MFTDVHCHLADSCFFGEEEKIVAGWREVGVDQVIDSGFDLPSSIRAKANAERFTGVYFSAGFQPQELFSYRDEDLEQIAELCKHEKCVAVGEIGLDYHYPDNPEKEFQKKIFVQEMEIARELHLPIVIHSRDSAADMLALLKENKDKLSFGGVMHCYSHGAELAKDFLALGFYLSYGGTSTYTGSKKVLKSILATPVERILTETDSPYLTPEPKKGEFPNTPKNIPLIAQKIASIKGMETSELALAVRKNAELIFPKMR